MDRINLYEEATKGVIHEYQVGSGVRAREERPKPQAVGSAWPKRPTMGLTHDVQGGQKLVITSAFPR
jgi:hypothetical protein